LLGYLNHGPFDWKKYEPIRTDTDGKLLWLRNGVTRVENAKLAGITSAAGVRQRQGSPAAGVIQRQGSSGRGQTYFQFICLRSGCRRDAIGSSGRGQTYFPAAGVRPIFNLFACDQDVDVMQLSAWHDDCAFNIPAQFTI
jgi:hypothetical protein